MKKIFSKIKWFVWEFFHNSLGSCDGKKFKITAGWVIYWVIGVILSVMIPYLLLWLESGQITFNLIAVIWAPEETYGYRIGYTVLGIPTCLSLVGIGYLTSKRINGDKRLLGDKIALKFVACLGLGLGLVCLIASFIIY